MKTESVKKVMRVGSMLLIGITICVFVWFFLREHKTREFQGQSRDGIAADNQNSPQLVQDRGEEPLTKEERVARQARSMFMSSFSEEQLALPHFQKILEAMDSPEYVELLTSGNSRSPKGEDFWKSKGVPVTRGHNGLFTEHPPFMSLADYEPVVRQKLANFFLAADPVDMTDPKAAAIQRGKVLIELDETDENGLAWFMERFGDDWLDAIDGDGWNGDIGGIGKSNPALEWLTDVQQNAASIVAAAEQARVDALEASAPSWDLSSVMESPSASHSETEALTTINTSEKNTMTDTEIEAAIEKSLTPQPPDIPTNKSPDTPGEIQSNLETTLKAQFSSERFDRAMNTLDQYGPEEGLRRLRENDPEIARQIENAKQHNREEVSR